MLLLVVTATGASCGSMIDSTKIIVSFGALRAFLQGAPRNLDGPRILTICPSVPPVDARRCAAVLRYWSYVFQVKTLLMIL